VPGHNETKIPETKVGLVNRRLNYISAAWRTLSHHVRGIICAVDAEGKTTLKRRLAMQKIQSDLSLRCLQLSGIEMDQAIQDALRELGLLLGADRTCL